MAFRRRDGSSAIIRNKPGTKPSVRKFIAIIVILTITAGGGYAYWTIGGGYAYWTDAAPDSSAAKPGGRPRANVAMPVEAEAVTVTSINREIRAVGSLRSNESVVIRPEIAGRITEILFREGEAAEKGQPLIILDSSVHRAQLAQARAGLELSRANNARALKLFKRGAGTGRARDEAIAQLRQDEANLALAKARMAKTTIRAPFGGVLGLRRVSVGDYLNPGQAVVNLEDIDPTKVDFRIPEIYMGTVRVGQRISISVDAFPKRKFDGKVYAIDPLVDESGRAIVIRARAPNTGGPLRPGMFARVNLIVETRDNAVMVPEQALVPRGADQFVFRVVEGKAMMSKVRVGLRRAAHAEILDGLGPTDVVVTAGQQKIRNGAPVRVVAAKRGGQG